MLFVISVIIIIIFFFSTQ